MNKKITIITVCFNNLSGLKRTIRSIDERKSDSIEFIIVDGGSTDGSLELIKNKAKIVDNYISEADNGIFDAQNKGADLASGDYLLFVNAGDILVHDDIADLIANQTNDIIYGDLAIKDYDKSIHVHYPDKLTKSFLFNESLPHPASFIKRTVFEEHSKYNLEYEIASDYDFFLKCYFDDNSFTHLDEIISQFEKGGVSSNESFGSNHIEETRSIRREYFSVLERIYLKLFVIRKKLRYLKFNLFDRIK